MANNKTPKKREFISVDGATAEVKDTIQSATKNAVNDNSSNGSQKTPKARANGLRIIAVIMWLVAIAFEVLAILLLNGTLYMPGDKMIWLIVGIVLDLIFVVIGSLLWKKSNRIDPVSEKNKIKFYLWNNMGVIASIIAFLPLVVLLLKNKNLDAKTKKIVTVIAALAMLVAIGFSIDYNPVSQEDLAQAQRSIGSDTVYWTRWGHSYHLDPNCQTLLNSAVVYQGDIDQSFEANRTDPCDFCADGNNEK